LKVLEKSLNISIKR